MQNELITIAIDGPSGSGKSTISQRLGQILSILPLNTGSMYRMMGLYFVQRNLDYNDKNVVLEHLNNINIDIKYENGQQVDILNGEVVTHLLRTNEVTAASSVVSQIKEIREKAVKLQREVASKMSVIMEGRDIGTVVLPNAKYKFFLTASNEERAKRRLKENLEKNLGGDYESILKAIIERDLRDQNREHSPLKKADDAILIDSTNMTIEEVVNEILKYIKR